MEKKKGGKLSSISPAKLLEPERKGERRKRIFSAF